jgi:hypothetical protein
MKKIIRLTESDLVKLVKRVISEQQTGSAKGPKMSSGEAKYISSKLNSSGVEYLDSNYTVVSPFTLTFFVSPKGSGGQFAKEYTQAEKATTQEFNYVVGDKLTIDESSDISRIYSGVKATSNGKTIVFKGNHPNDTKGIIVGRDLNMYSSTLK